MEINFKDISHNPGTDKFMTCIAVKLIDGNAMMLKAKAALYADVMEGLGELVDAAIAEFVESYGEEVVKFAHQNTVDDLRDTEPVVKFVDSKDISRKLLKKAFPKEANGL